MAVHVDDYSTEMGLRVRITCDTTGTCVQMPAEEFHQFLMQCRTGAFDDLALEPEIPFVHWKAGDKYPGESSTEERNEVSDHFAGHRAAADAQLAAGQPFGPRGQGDEEGHQ
jgi:hypothetical protein